MDPYETCLTDEYANLITRGYDHDRAWREAKAVADLLFGRGAFRTPGDNRTPGVNTGNSQANPGYNTREVRPAHIRPGFIPPEINSQYQPVPVARKSSLSGSVYTLYRVRTVEPRAVREGPQSSGTNHTRPAAPQPTRPIPSDPRLRPPTGIRPPNNLYDVLGVERNVNAADLRAAWRRMCLRYHPDRAPQSARAHATVRMAEINTAYEVLRDYRQREFYDRHGLINTEGR